MAMTDEVAEPSADDELLALRLRALAHPARLAILRALAEVERCQCGHIVRGLTLAQSTVSQHLKVLKEAGLVTGAIEGPRSCYCIDREAVASLAREIGPLLAVLAGEDTCAASSPDARAGALVSGAPAPISSPYP